MRYIDGLYHMHIKKNLIFRKYYYTAKKLNNMEHLQSENKILTKGIIKKNPIIKIKSYEPRVTTTESRRNTR
jgi:hypothetical protein